MTTHTGEAGPIHSRRHPRPYHQSCSLQATHSQLQYNISAEADANAAVVTIEVHATTNANSVSIYIDLPILTNLADRKLLS